MGLPYYPMYPADFEADTSHLTMLEDGAYNRLLRLCWMTPGCSLPADEAWIMRRARAHTDAEKEAVRVVLDEFFTTDAGRVKNRRLSREAMLAEEAHAKRVAAGRKGGRNAKALKENDTGPSNAQAMPKQPEPEPDKSSVEDKSSTGAGAPLDPEKIMFDSGRELLMAAGLSRQQAGSVLGKFKKAHGTEAVIAAIGRARRENAQNPVEFMQGVFKWERKGGKPQVGDTRQLPDGRVQEYAGGVEGWMEVHG